MHPEGYRASTKYMDFEFVSSRHVVGLSNTLGELTFLLNVLLVHAMLVGVQSHLFSNVSA